MGSESQPASLRRAELGGPCSQQRAAARGCLPQPLWKRGLPPTGPHRGCCPFRGEQASETRQAAQLGPLRGTFPGSSGWAQKPGGHFGVTASSLARSATPVLCDLQRASASSGFSLLVSDSSKGWRSGDVVTLPLLRRVRPSLQDSPCTSTRPLLLNFASFSFFLNQSNRISQYWPNSRTFTFLPSH